MQWKLSNLVGEYQAKTGERLSYRDIEAGTGISKTTIATVMRGETQRPDLDTLDALLSFMSEKLGRRLETGDLLEWVPSRNGADGEI